MTTTSKTRLRTYRTCCLCRQKRECSWNIVLQGFICQVCTLEQESYDSSNTRLMGQPQKRLPAFSLEFEIAPGKYSYTRERALILLKYGFLRTYDATVDDEYKSPIYRNIRAFRKPLSVLDGLRDLVTQACGTHLHIECRHKDLLQALHPEIFSPLLNHLLRQREETIHFWGRYFSQYAQAVNADRFHSFSLDSCHPTLQFRLPRFRTATQYLTIIQFGRATVTYLDRIFSTTQQKDATPNPLACFLRAGAAGNHILSLYKRYVTRLAEHEPWYSQESALEATKQAQEEQEDNDWNDFSRF